MRGHGYWLAASRPMPVGHVMSHHQLCVAYGTLDAIDSNQDTYFMGHPVQEWADDLNIDGRFHPTYNTTRAGLIVRYNSLLKGALKADSILFQGWMIHLADSL